MYSIFTIMTIFMLLYPLFVIINHIVFPYSDENDLYLKINKDYKETYNREPTLNEYKIFFNKRGLEFLKKIKPELFV